ncbi:hypothetical protein O6P43_020911 [Quillaja saponaria]|uniref:Uncharacterized protein n=1 Tax=Quillaja saponaria TaxID=32244 RepID=A0AAD7PLR6_QUISA|nr:hypothetical protein O6P43_020911 [Quillaja saponaria]KAJ7960476.1 hypothetical protein O6P43_020911 [Quillaja saponaria]
MEPTIQQQEHPDAQEAPSSQTNSVDDGLQDEAKIIDKQDGEEEPELQSMEQKSLGKEELERQAELENPEPSPKRMKQIHDHQCKKKELDLSLELTGHGVHQGESDHLGNCEFGFSLNTDNPPNCTGESAISNDGHEISEFQGRGVDQSEPIDNNQRQELELSLNFNGSGEGEDFDLNLKVHDPSCLSEDGTPGCETQGPNLSLKL